MISKIKFHTVSQTSALAILTMVLFFSIGFRVWAHSEDNLYDNYNASYHVLLTTKALDENPISRHHFLPIVSLGRDENIPWGACVADSDGKYYYTSFPSGGFLAPHLFFWIFGLTSSIDNLFIFSSIILTISVLLVFFLVRDIVSHLSPSHQKNQLSYAPALATSLIYLSALETFYSHGYIYWSHSLQQPIYLTFIFILFKIFSKSQVVLKYAFWLFCISLLMGSTEWSGYLISLGACFAIVLSYLEKRDKFQLIISCGAGSLVAICIHVINFGMVIGLEKFFKTSSKRFKVRSFGEEIGLTDLLLAYGESYGLLLIILGIAI